MKRCSASAIRISFTFVFIMILGLACQFAMAAQYGEAPMLVPLVKAGKLPPVNERLPEEPAVVKPVEETGQYGGTARVVTVRPQILEDGGLMMSQEPILRIDSDGKTVVPNIAKKWEFTSDGKTLTLYLRKGMKWSDGQPFTADDILFWWEDVVLNDELTPVKPKAWSPGGKLMKVEKLNEYAIRLHFAVPYPMALFRLAHSDGFEGSFFLPKHYLKQFHPKYTSKGDLEKLAKSQGFDTWSRLFLAKAQINAGSGRAVDPGTPTLKAYRIVHKGLDTVTAERNPYYWKVDPKGNQLPYIDRIFVMVVKDFEMVNMKITSGEVDFAGFNTLLENYPLYRQVAKRNNYRVLMWQDVFGGELILMPNQTHSDPVMRKIFQDRRFRIALSLGINREEMNQLFYLELAEPRQTTVIPQSSYYEPEFAKAYIEYNPEKANRLLDEMGLKRGADGYRLRPDGKRLEILIEYTRVDTPRGPLCEFVQQGWEKLGLKVAVKEITGELQDVRARGNLMDMTVWNADKNTDVLFPITPMWYVPMSWGWENSWCPLWAQWYVSGGKAGEEPPQEMKRLISLWEKMQSVMDDQERIKLGKEILRSQAENLWTIGTVGLAPHPVIVRDNLRNVPEKGLWGWDTIWTYIYHPEQFFFKQK
ncbi:MAG: ABC transporter substrate-binding protein [Firmicutes bacterium]|nr:ABC transporter substrate-binding protein [Bacillota bacterium]